MSNKGIIGKLLSAANAVATLPWSGEKTDTPKPEVSYSNSGFVGPPIPQQLEKPRMEKRIKDTIADMANLNREEQRQKIAAQLQPYLPKKETGFENYLHEENKKRGALGYNIWKQQHDKEKADFENTQTRMRKFLEPYQKDETVYQHPLAQKYGIDPYNFGMNELFEWANQHNMLYNLDTGKLEPRKKGAFLGIGGTPLATEEEIADAKALTMLANAKFDSDLFGDGDSAYSRIASAAYGFGNGATFDGAGWLNRLTAPKKEEREYLEALIPQEYQPHTAYNRIKTARDAHPKLYEKSNLAGQMAATYALRNANAGLMRGAFDGFRYAPYLEKLATQGLTLGARQGMLAAIGQPTDEEWAESEEAKRKLYEAYGREYTPQELNIFDRARNIKSNALAGAADGIGSTVMGDMIGTGMENAMARYGMQFIPAEYAQQGIVGTTGTTMADPRMAVYWDNNAIRYIAPEKLPWYEPWMEAYRDGADRLLLQDGADSGIMKLPENSGEGIITIGRYDDLKPNVKNSFDKYSSSGWKGNFSGQTQKTAAGSKWKNTKQQLPVNTNNGDPITYREFDVNNRIPGMRRDAERFLYGSDGSVYYTSDHYRTFVKIK